ncbi:Ger(x)C family spore germination protein [Paenibacillus aceris]|uniref:Spore germination protein KC n=1 Tax=Paenibacillus aceris TaxID=869555 RepID=A0ABS4I192_9BACL|nr:Ger(x)C family spore germination protein [Paenibacillus aceris]MBP1964568.1 spore germination protein KC [Paenibacillus aceris]NHW35723.1 Ger(x)C family spore germination protein [Paenibacillus aceris]
MKSRVVLGLLLLFVLPGCWDKAELTEYAFVQAVAIDQSESMEFELTIHSYNPSSGAEVSGAIKQVKKGINIKTKADTIFEAVRDIPIHLGRKAKWDHMRVILISDKVARNQNVGEILDFFSRDHEPRSSVLLLISEGNAGDYLEIKPFIENTIGQQLRKIEESATKFSAKTSTVPLLDLAIQMQSETGTAMVPYIHKDNPPNYVSVAGIALLKKGKMVSGIVTPFDTQRLLMLMNKYESGILEIPCPADSSEKKKLKESIEVNTLDTKVTPIIKGKEVTVSVVTKIKGSVSELHCSVLKSKEDDKRFEDRIKKMVEHDIQRTITILQKDKMDIIGVGNKIFRKNPVLWKKLKPTWEERFAEMKFNVDVEITVLNTGLNAGTPFSEGGGG